MSAFTPELVRELQVVALEIAAESPTRFSRNGYFAQVRRLHVQRLRSIFERAGVDWVEVGRMQRKLDKINEEARVAKEVRCWYPKPIEREDAGGPLYVPARLDTDEEADITPSHDRATIAAECDRMNGRAGRP